MLQEINVDQFYSNSLMYPSQVLCCVDKQGVLSWPNPSPETVLFFSGRVEPPHDSQEELRDDLSINSFCRLEGEEDRDEVRRRRVRI